MNNKNSRLRYLILMRGSNHVTLFFGFIVCLLLSSVCSAQSRSREELEQRNKEILKNIDIAKETLDQTGSKKKNTLDELDALNQLVSMRKAYIRSLEEEIGYIEEDAKELSGVISSMERDLDSLKSEYAEMLYQSSKVKNNISQATLLLSSRSYNQLSLRLRFLEQFSDARRNQVEKIKAVKTSLERRNNDLKEKQKQKQQKLEDIRQEKQKLDKLKKQQADMVKELSQKEEQLNKRLDKLRKEQEKVQMLIQQAIEEELRRQKEERKKKEASGQYVDRRGDKIISEKFEVNKGRLPWPLGKCFVSRNFGMQPHPQIKGVKVNNIGLTLRTPSVETPVQSVFKGKVITVAEVPGAGMVVMIRHGEYFTVYSGLKQVKVKVGDEVEAKHHLGAVRVKSGGVTEMDFQIWKGKKPLDPDPWLYK